MRVVVVSDTHGRHEEYGVLEGDVLIHCGDGSESSNESVEALDEWFGRQRFEQVLAVGGNHDFKLLERTRAGARAFHHARFLVDETVEIGGLRFHGSPWIPGLIGWAFFAKNEVLAARWALIPANTDDRDRMRRPALTVGDRVIKNGC